LPLAHASQENAQRDLSFQPSQIGAQAKMGTEPKGEVAIVRTCDVEDVRVGKDALIAVGGA
jgi:hypothetical protein